MENKLSEYEKIPMEFKAMNELQFKVLNKI